jgi:hypothetical protein
MTPAATDGFCRWTTWLTYKKTSPCSRVLAQTCLRVVLHFMIFQTSNTLSWRDEYLDSYSKNLDEVPGPQPQEYHPHIACYHTKVLMYNTRTFDTGFATRSKWYSKSVKDTLRTLKQTPLARLGLALVSTKRRISQVIIARK